MLVNFKEERVFCACHYGVSGFLTSPVLEFGNRWSQGVIFNIYSILHGTESFLEANWFAASQEIPHISRNPKVHYRTHKRPPTVSILGQPNPVHIPTSHLLEIHPNIIHPSTSRSPQWSLSLRFPHQDLQYTIYLTANGLSAGCSGYYAFT